MFLVVPSRRSDWRRHVATSDTYPIPDVIRVTLAICCAWLWRDAVGSLPRIAYEEHVIYRTPMDCYHHAVDCWEKFRFGYVGFDAFDNECRERQFSGRLSRELQGSSTCHTAATVRHE